MSNSWHSKWTSEKSTVISVQIINKAKKAQLQKTWKPLLQLQDLYLSSQSSLEPQKHSKFIRNTFYTKPIKRAGGSVSITNSSPFLHWAQQAIIFPLPALKPFTIVENAQKHKLAKTFILPRILHWRLRRSLVECDIFKAKKATDFQSYLRINRKTRKSTAFKKAAPRICRYSADSADISVGIKQQGIWPRPAVTHAAARLNFAISLNKFPHFIKLLESKRNRSQHSPCPDGCPGHHRACLQSASIFQSCLCQCCRSHPRGKGYQQKLSTTSLGKNKIHAWVTGDCRMWVGRCCKKQWKKEKEIKSPEFVLPFRSKWKKCR